MYVSCDYKRNVRVPGRQMLARPAMALCISAKRWCWWTVEAMVFLLWHSVGGCLWARVMMICLPQPPLACSKVLVPSLRWRGGSYRVLVQSLWWKWLNACTVDVHALSQSAGTDVLQCIKMKLASSGTFIYLSTGCIYYINFMTFGSWYNQCSGSN